MAEADQLALNPSVAPAGILAGQSQHQGPDRQWGGWSALIVRAGRSSGGRIGPASATGFGATPVASGAARQPAQCAEDGAVEPGQRGAGIAWAQHRGLVTGRQDFDVLWLRRIGRAARASSARARA